MALRFGFEVNEDTRLLKEVTAVYYFGITKLWRLREINTLRFPQPLSREVVRTLKGQKFKLQYLNTCLCLTSILCSPRSHDLEYIVHVSGDFR